MAFDASPFVWTANRDAVEHGSFQAMLIEQTNEIRANYQEATRLSRVSAFQLFRAPPIRALVGDYGHRYYPEKIALEFSNPLGEARGEQGRLAKITPTIIHHEVGHSIFHALTHGRGNVGVNEGMADAFTAYHNEDPRIGFVDPVTPNADEASRNIEFDTIPYPGDARRVIAGAMWEIRNETFNANLEDGEVPFHTALAIRTLDFASSTHQRCRR